MNKTRISILTFLFIVLMGTCVAGSQGAGTSQSVVSYPTKASSLLKSPGGGTYRLSLVPDFDVRGNVVTLDLVLQRPGNNADDSNLLDSTGNLHGYQPYVFAASDFAGGAQKSAYGESRVIDLRKLGMEMHVKVAEVHVEPTPGDSAQGLGYRFHDLTLEITTQSVSERDSSKPGQ